ncbi:MAG: hypothetical protein RML94_14895, partial [Bacteroidia bacterium]|nr:hypothetical protein [Bacteroidia bacterium]
MTVAQNKVLWFFIAWMVIMSGYSQTEEASFKPKFNIGFDNKNSFIGDKTVRFNGFLTTIQIGPRSRLGMGYYTLSKNSQFTDVSSQNGIDTLITVRNFRYYSMEYHYILLNTAHWELYFPFEVGIGG